MHLREFNLILLLLLVGGFMFPQTVNAQISIEPYGIALAMENDDEVSTEFVLNNTGDADVAFDISFDVIEPGEQQQAGPRRDEPQGRFAIFQDDAAWGNFLHQQVLDQVEGLEYVRYQSGDFEDFPIEDFDVVWVVHNEQQDAYNREYNNNRARISEWVNSGGVYYASTGTNRYNVAPVHPGGLVRTGSANDNVANGRVAISSDPEDENYNYLAELMEWNPNDLLRGASLFNCHYEQDDIDEIANSDWYQVIATLEGTNTPGILVYNYGLGTCVVSGTLDGHQHANYNQAPNWGSAGEELCYYLDYLTTTGWFSATPESGVFPTGEETNIEMVFKPLNVVDGIYEIIIEINLDDQSTMFISVFVSVGTPVGNVFGTVSRSDNGDPIEGAEIKVMDHNYSRWSDENGEFVLENVPVDAEFTVNVIADDFLLYDAVVQLDEAGDVDWDIELLHATCDIQPEEINYSVEPDFVLDGIELAVSNNGDGPLDWSVERHLLGNADTQPWELRQEIEAGDEVEDFYLSGVVYIDGLYYVSGGNGRAAENFIYVLNEEGHEVDRFPQFHESDNGMRDLAWGDGLIWGGDARTVYGFTPNGDLRAEFEVAVEPAIGMTWDTDNNILWVTSVNTPLYGYDRQGNLVGEIEKQMDLNIRGLGYYPEDPDGFNIYIFTRDRSIEAGESLTRIFKLNPDDGEIRFVRDLHAEGHRAGGLFISGQVDIYSWVLICLYENGARTPDAIGLWQIDVRLNWMEVEPLEGVIEPGESQQFELILNASDLILAEYEGELIFSHDGVGRETHLPIVMRVTDGPVQTFRNLDLHFGWNLISLNLEPDDADVVNMMEPLTEAGDLIIMKNGAGEFYLPGLDEPFNSIDGWNAEEAYMLKMSRDARLRINGVSVVANDAIALSNGWNLASYYPRRPVEATISLSGLVETGHLQIVKDERGRFYVPQYNFSNIGVLREGKGYQFRVDADVELIYVQELPEGAMAGDRPIHRQILSTTKQLPEVPNTGLNMSMLLTTDQSVSGEIGVYAGERLVGSGVLEDGYCGVAVWGDDPTTAEIDGALNDEILTVRLVDGFNSRTLSYSSLTGSANYQTDSFWAIELEESETAMPESFGLESVYPNPFNSQAQVRFALLKSGQVDLALYDLSGRLVNRLVSGVRQAGFHTATVNGIGLPSGMYIVQLKAEGQLAQQKITLIK